MGILLGFRVADMRLFLSVLRSAQSLFRCPPFPHFQHVIPLLFFLFFWLGFLRGSFAPTVLCGMSIPSAICAHTDARQTRHGRLCGVVGFVDVYV